MIRPPRAKIAPTRLVHLGHTRIDPYYWLKDRNDPQVLAYLEAENAYTEAVMAHTKDLEERLFEEIKGRIKQDDSSVPYRRDDHFYYVRFEEGQQYPLYCRKRESLAAPEQIMLDANAMARGHDFFDVGRWSISRGQSLLAFSVDTVGRRTYTIQVKDLETGRILEDRIPGVSAGMAWANDDRTLFYARLDPTTLRPCEVRRHVLGTPVSDDPLVFEELDDTFSVHVWKTKSRKYLIVGSFQTLSSECRYLEADDPGGTFRLIEPRERDHEYTVDHYRDHFYIRTNHVAKNFRLVRAPVDRPERARWQEVIPHREDVLLEDFEIFGEHLVLEERRDGLIRLRVRPWSGGEEHVVDFGEPAYLAYIDANFDFDTRILRYGYTSMTTPRSVFDYDMTTRGKVLLKQDEVLGGFDAGNYVTERLTAVARDGTRVPVSLVYRKGMRRDGSHPLLLYGYGAYGLSMDAAFASPRLSLIDRGFIHAIAHVRGGEELGRSWYEDGKLLRKMNTFTDFIDCAEHLIEAGYTSRGRLFATGGSAGGLLVGAVMNLRPDLFEGVVASVPFVDLVTTMLDDSLPLTTGEYDEWGDPHQKEYYDYMLSYSPYDNVGARPYPHLLVLTGFHDSQVQYWEPAKWVAALRARKIGDNHLLLKTNMEAGHRGASGRFRRHRETALEYAFLLDLAGKSDQVKNHDLLRPGSRPRLPRPT